MASNSKRKQDEKHLKMLREMVALAHNKQCFDCHQRGPTYINMTIGSYVCTACSGLLRGLNPPHRVKSISMASFTPDEMEFIKSHGNEFNRKCWLGLYDNRMGNQSESREENKVKDFMTQKYERKRYYVAPTDTMKEEAKKMNESAISKAPGTRPLKSLLGENAPRLVVQSNQVKSTATNPPAISQPPVSSVSQAHNPPPQSPGNQSVQSSKSSGSTAMDLLGDLGNDPFASTSSTQPQPSGGGGFADFGNFGSTGSTMTSTQSQPPAFAGGAPLQLGGQGTPASVNGAFGATSTTSNPVAGGGDRYAALADLFSSPAETTTAASSTSVGWSTMSSTAPVGGTGGGVNWGGATSSSSGGINWGGDSTSGGGGSINWNSSSSAAPVTGGNSSWGTTGTTSSWNAAPATTANGYYAPGEQRVPHPLGTPGNPFLQPAVVNPFGGSSNTSLTSQSAPGSAPNPFGASSGAGGFGQFGAPSTTSTAGGFGQFGMQNGFNTAPSAGGFQGQPAAGQGFGGQPPQGFGSQPTQGFGGQPAAGQGFGGQPTQGFGGQPGSGFGGQQMGGGFGGQPGGWGQMPASNVNPFMSTASQQAAPKTGSTNPFL